MLLIDLFNKSFKFILFLTPPDLSILGNIIKYIHHLNTQLIEIGGAELYPTPHFVPEGISSSLRDFTVLVLNNEVFQIKFS